MVDANGWTVRTGFVLATTAAVFGEGCSETATEPPAAYVQPREACAQQDSLRKVFFGDLHVHTRNSFDAWVFDVRTTPEDAYRFARGQPIAHPLGQGGTVQLARPLDFAAVTDHAEYLGEISLCTTPGSSVYDSRTCARYREGGSNAVTAFGGELTRADPRRFSDVCGDGRGCTPAALDVWGRIRDAAEAAYDRTSACRFTTFSGYEWTGATEASNFHRNIIFKNDRVPDTVSSYFDERSVLTMHATLRSTCLDVGNGCDVIAIPHNMNWSNGNMFFVEYPPAIATLDQQRPLAELRQRLEPLVEIYQHKGDMECANGLSGILGAPDELCDFEKLRRTPEDCGDGTGAGGAGGIGCVSRLDFLRGILLEGMREERRLGVNPYRLGVIASTDTHNGTPGLVSEQSYPGHWGNNEDTVARRLGRGTITPGGVIFSGGGLVAAWAEQNTRESLFDAFRRREVYGTSGPRIAVRFFGGWDYPADLCGRPDLVDVGYAAGVPMGGNLPPRPGAGAPAFVVDALMDPGTGAGQPVPLERVQIVKGWLDTAGQASVRVYDIAGEDRGASVDLATCARASAAGAPSLCGVWRDPDFDPSQPAYYYVRVLEEPTCRWSGWQCLSLAEEDRPESCEDPMVPKTIRERAWTSPIWYTP